MSVFGLGPCLEQPGKSRRLQGFGLAQLGTALGWEQQNNCSEWVWEQLLKGLRYAGEGAGMDPKIFLQ